MIRRLLPILITGLASWMIAACAHQQYIIHRQVTGTCGGACDTYLECKGNGTDQKWAACVGECTDFFNDPQALRELERMDCTDIVAFIEGPSGRGPGEAPPANTASTAQRHTSRSSSSSRE